MVPHDDTIHTGETDPDDAMRLILVQAFAALSALSDLHGGADASAVPCGRQAGMTHRLRHFWLR